MFSWGIHTVATPSTLTLTVPMHYIMLLVLSVSMLVPLILTIKAGRPVRNLIIFLLIVLVYEFLTYSSQLTLDRKTETAILREFEFFHWRTTTYPLDAIDNLNVSTGSTTSQLRLQFTNGDVKSITFLDQSGGKEKAAYLANQFLNEDR